MTGVLRESAQSLTTIVHTKVSLRYLLYVPAHCRRGSRRKFPLVLFLHGAGERGRNLNAIKKHGVSDIMHHCESRQAIVVAPQCPAGDWWDPVALRGLLDHLESQFPVDPRRVYLTGLSMGGFGTWFTAAELPKRFAAIVPICGGGNWLLAHKIRHLPIWAFHGAKDTVVPLERTEQMIKALRNLGARPRFTIYPDAGHDSWSETYRNPALYTWLFRQRRKS